MEFEQTLYVGSFLQLPQIIEHSIMVSDCMKLARVSGDMSLLLSCCGMTISSTLQMTLQVLC